MSDNLPDVPETVRDLLGEADEPGFDPADLPGAEVMFEGGDVRLIRVPLDAVPEGEPREGVGTLGDFPFPVSDSDGLDPMGLLLSQVIQASWAMDEMQNAFARHNGDKHEAIKSAYTATAEPGVPYMDAEPMFRAHAHEIFERAAAGEPLEPGTDAEVLATLVVGAEQGSPFCGGLTSLFFRLAKQFLPEGYPEFCAAEGMTLDDADDRIEAGREDSEHHLRDLREILSRSRKIDDAIAGLNLG